MGQKLYLSTWTWTKTGSHQQPLRAIH